MWIWLDKNGTVKQYLTHGSSPVVGETDFKIFAYFDDLDVENIYPEASIKFRKPDRQGSVYPLLFMKRTSLLYQHLEEDGSNSNFTDGQRYTGFLFDFSDFLQDEEVVSLLDTPGLWEATITLLNIGSPKTNVSGLITFYVGSSASDNENDTNLTLDQILTNLVLSMNALNRSSTSYIKNNPDFVTNAHNGTLPAKIYTIGSIVFSEADQNFYKILTVTVNENDDDYVSATYTRAFEYLKIKTGTLDLTLKDVFDMDDGNIILLNIDHEYYTIYSSDNTDTVIFEIKNMTNGKRYHGEVPYNTQLRNLINDTYYVPGTYYTPHVSADGDLSWTNNNDEPNPPTVNIRGPIGKTPVITNQTQTQTTAPGTNANVSVTKSGTDENPNFSWNFAIPRGDKGESSANAVWFEINEDGDLILYYSTAASVESIYLVNDDPYSLSYWQTLGVPQNLVGHVIFMYKED